MTRAAGYAFYALVIAIILSALVDVLTYGAIS